MAGVTTLDDEQVIVAPARLRFGVDVPEPKFQVPKAGGASVARTELLDRLARERDRPAVLVSAPGGYGKTTLLAQWARHSARPCAWLTLDQADGDPRVLRTSVATALDRAGIKPDLGCSFGLVLDDAHLIPHQLLKDAVRIVLGWLPEGSQLALGSRCEPRLPLGRMRAQRMLAEVGSQDLAMSAAESAVLLRKAGLEPGSASAQTLIRRTEGWPVALELATTAWTQRTEEAEPAAQLSGDDHVISEYFRAELLGSLSPTAVRFLTRSSLLERLSGSLCDELLGRTRSAAVLAELVRSNVPLLAVDASHEWYRLHGLFREMLQTELRRSEPEIVRELHRRAGDWYSREGDLDRALDHADRAGDLDRLGELLWTHLPGYLGQGRSHQVQGWLRTVTPDRGGARAPVALAAAHASLASGSVAVAEQWARTAAVRVGEASGEAAEQERAGVLMIEAWIARSGAAGMGELAARGYALLPDDSPWRAGCCFLRGTAALLTGDDDQAERLLERGAARGAVLAPDAAGLCLAQLAVLAAERHQDAVASDFARRARSVAVDHDLTGTPGTALVFAVDAAAGMREGLIDEAKAAVSESLSLLEAFSDPLAWFAAETQILLSRTLLALGDVAGARSLLAEASRLARRTPDAVIFARWFDDAWDQFDQRAESALAGVALLTTAELRVLRFLPTHYSFQEIAERLHVSSNTVKTHVHAVYRKLDASSRSEAVAHAAQAGLLGG
jgi:LuxR family maltose regulon positive regulatory protein